MVGFKKKMRILKFLRIYGLAFLIDFVLNFLLVVVTDGPITLSDIIISFIFTLVSILLFKFLKLFELGE